MVVIPAVLESGELNKVCVSLMKPNESLAVTVTLNFEERNMTLVGISSAVEINICSEFQVSCADRA